MTPVRQSRSAWSIRWNAALVAALFLVFAPTQLLAQIDIFLKVGDIVGESRDSVRQGHSIANAWSWGGIQNAIDPLTRATKSTFHNLNITKPIDTATPRLMLACARGNRFDRATLILRKSGATPVEFYRVILEDVIVRSVQDSSSSDGNPSENISLNFARIGVEYFQITPKGTPGNRFEFAWDIANNKQGGVIFPTAADADADGLPDAWEVQYGLNSNTNDADRDPDGDGATNYEEYIAGTSPIDANQVLRARLDFATPTAGATLTLPTVPGKTYRILTSDNITGPFNPIQTIQATDTTTTIPASINFPAQYFKVEVVP